VVKTFFFGMVPAKTLSSSSAINVAAPRQRAAILIFQKIGNYHFRFLLSAFCFVPSKHFFDYFVSFKRYSKVSPVASLRVPASGKIAPVILFSNLVLRFAHADSPP
jgi:hypothetical protein